MSKEIGAYGESHKDKDEIQDLNYIDSIIPTFHNCWPIGYFNGAS